MFRGPTMLCFESKPRHAECVRRGRGGGGGGGGGGSDGGGGEVVGGGRVVRAFGGSRTGGGGSFGGGGVPVTHRNAQMSGLWHWGPQSGEGWPAYTTSTPSTADFRRLRSCQAQAHGPVKQRPQTEYQRGSLPDAPSVLEGDGHAP